MFNVSTKVLSAKTKVLEVANSTARLALTSADVNVGDIVKQLDINTYFTVVDNTNLTNSGWSVVLMENEGSVRFIPVHGTASEQDSFVGEEGEISSDGETIRLHDGVTPGGKKFTSQNSTESSILPRNAPGTLFFSSRKSSGNITLIVYGQNNSWLAVQKWDGTITTQQCIGGQANISLAVPASGAWSGASIKEFFIWQCISSSDTTPTTSTLQQIDFNSPLIDFHAFGTNLTNIRGINTSFSGFYIDMRETQLVHLEINDAPNLRGLFGLTERKPYLTTLVLGNANPNNGGTDSPCPFEDITAFRDLRSSSWNALQIFRANLPALDGLVNCEGSGLGQIHINGLINEINLTGCSLLYDIGLVSPNLVSLDASDASTLININVQRCSALSNLIVPSIINEGSISLGSCPLTTSSSLLNAFLTSLPVVAEETSFLVLPGTLPMGTDINIATSKGWLL